jgi:hypothetical protein
MRLTPAGITAAYNRLLAARGTDAEQSAFGRDRPAELPTEAELIARAVEHDIKNPADDPADLLAALQLTTQDQANAQSREVNVVSRLRAKGVPWRVIAQYRGLDSAQAAQQRYDRITRRSPRASQPGAPGAMLVAETLIYAFRIAGEPEAPWFGDPDLLPEGQYATELFPFLPAVPRPPFSGRTLEVRYGPVEAEVLPGYLRAIPQIGNRRIAMTAAVQEALFGA